MTDFNKRLDKIIEKAIRKGIKIGKDIPAKDMVITSFSTDSEYHDLAQLFRDMIKESKPYQQPKPKNPMSDVGDAYDVGWNESANEFESNLLKMIGEER